MSVKYNIKTNIPHYIPKADPPLLTDCVKNEKYRKLKKRIEQSNVSKLEKQFLLCAATRHIVFNYSKIADYYASASKEMQELMEESALVIIDFNDAIKNGYVQLNKKMTDIINNRLEQENEE